MSTSPFIQISDLDIGFDSSAGSKRFYPSISMPIYKGELIALVGRNGVGKSTLLRSIARLQPILSGSIHIDGIPFNSFERSDYSRLLSYIPAEPIHAANMTVQEFVAIARYPYHGWFGSMSNTDKEVVKMSLESVGMIGFLHRELDSLSDGERQRAMIAFAIAQDSQVVLMDEPTAFIDLPNKFEIVRLLKVLAGRGKTVIFSTHDLYTALREVDTMWLMLNDGIVSGSPEDLALNGSLNRLLEGTDVFLDLASSSFVSKRHGNLQINLIVDDEIIYKWTKQALERIGYSIIQDENMPLLKSIVKDGSRIWIYSDKSIQKSFGSISELCMFLKRSKD